MLASAALVNRLAALPSGIAKRSIGRLRLCGKENEIELYALTAAVSATGAGSEVRPFPLEQAETTSAMRRSYWQEVCSGSSTLFQAQAARFRFSPNSGRIAASHRSATKSADAQRGAAVGGELRQAAGAVASVATDKRGVTRSQPQIHDSPRNQLYSKSIGMGRRTVHVSVNMTLAA